MNVKGLSIMNNRRLKQLPTNMVPIDNKLETFHVFGPEPSHIFSRSLEFNLTMESIDALDPINSCMNMKHWIVGPNVEIPNRMIDTL